MPTNIKTLGDLIQIKRYENRLTLGQLAIKMGIAAETVKAWERDKEIPGEGERRMLARILAFDAGMEL